MIFRNALYRELTATAISVFIVIVGISLIVQVSRFLGQAAAGMLAADGIATLLGFSVLQQLPFLLVFTLYLAVLLTISRAYRDREMMVWLSSGLSLFNWLRPLAAFSLPLVITIALLSLFLSPWAVEKSEEFRRYLETRDEISAIAPGQFTAAKQGESIYFVEAVNPLNGLFSNVFLQSREHSRSNIIIAEKARLRQEPNGDRFLVLTNGHRYEGTPGTPQFRVVEFAEMGQRVEPAESRGGTPSMKSRTTLDLVLSPSAAGYAELYWRISMPLFAVVLVLMALPLSYANPRAGRSWNFVAALLVAQIYLSLTNVLQVWIGQQRVGFVVGLTAAHAVMAIAALAILLRQAKVFLLKRD